MKTYCNSIKKITLFALSSRPDTARLESGLKAMGRFFPEAEISFPDFQKMGRCRRLAGSDEERAEAFNRAASDSSTQMLVAARGGYGVTRVLDRLDFELLRRQDKWLVGYSDVTALLLAACHCGCRRLIHGPMVCSSWADAQAVPEHYGMCSASLERAMRVSEHGGPLLDSFWQDGDVLREGTGRGRLLPCNMTMLECLIGTPFISLEDFDGAILMLEDISVPAHAIDRSLRHLLQAGILPRLSGLAFGSFSDCEDEHEVPEILKEYADYVAGPVVSGVQFGHCMPAMALPFGTLARLNVSKNKILLEGV